MLLTCSSCIRQHVRNYIVKSLQQRQNHGNATATLVRSNESSATHPGYTGSEGHTGNTYAETREKWLKSRGQTPAHKLAKRNVDLGARKRYAVNKHLEFLQDPVKLANDVLQTLRRDEFGEALEVVRAASKNRECVVSWNHLIGWCLSKGKVRRAVNIYNEMKKRLQQPDNHTFTILFRGLASFTHYPHTLETALSIYHSMLVDTSRVKPNRTHTNAMLKVCARANNMDALFGIAAKLPVRGPGAADNLTFTTILNALRMYVIGDDKVSLSEVEMEAILRKTIIDARRMWDDIIGRWRKSDIAVDEELTCSMGRILLLGKDPKDLDDVFSLIQQTMNIPRLFPRLEANETTGIEGVADSADEFGALMTLGPDKHGNSGYVKPGNNTLSMVTEALQKSSKLGYAQKYWNIFTVDHEIKPDSENYAVLLRSFRLKRDSTGSLNVLKRMDPKMLEHKHFRIALATCYHDQNNGRAFRNAGKMLNILELNLEQLDVVTLSSYISTSLIQSDCLAKNIPNHREVFEAKLQAKKRIQRALTRLQNPLQNVRSHINYGGHKIQSPDKIKAQNFIKAVPKSKSYIENTIDLIAKMVSAHDKLINSGLLSYEQQKSHVEQRATLNSVIHNLKHRSEWKRSETRRKSNLEEEEVDVEAETDQSCTVAEEDRIAAERVRREMGRYVSIR